MLEILQDLVKRCHLVVKLDGWKWEFIAHGPLPVIVLLIILLSWRYAL